MSCERSDVLTFKLSNNECFDPALTCGAGLCGFSQQLLNRDGGVLMYRIWLSVFGTGYLPIMPGTFGSAVVAIVFLMAALLSGSPIIVLAVMLIVAVHGFLVTVIYSDRLIAELGPDPQVIVSDEQCGQAITFMWLWPIADWNNKEIIIFTLVGFVLFRIFDVVKPPPIRRLEKFKGGWGVVLDDILAGVYAQIVLQIVLRAGWLRFLAD